MTDEIKAFLESATVGEETTVSVEVEAPSDAPATKTFRITREA